MTHAPFCHSRVHLPPSLSLTSLISNKLLTKKQKHVTVFMLPPDWQGWFAVRTVDGGRGWGSRASSCSSSSGVKYAECRCQKVMWRLSGLCFNAPLSLAVSLCCVAGRKSRRLHQPRQLYDWQSHRVQEETVSLALHQAEYLLNHFDNQSVILSIVIFVFFLFPLLSVQCVQSLPPARHDVLFCCWEPRGHEPVSSLQVPVLCVFAHFQRGFRTSDGYRRFMLTH